jgi:hypothetical protein
MRPGTSVAVLTSTSVGLLSQIRFPSADWISRSGTQPTLALHGSDSPNLMSLPADSNTPGWHLIAGGIDLVITTSSCRPMPLPDWSLPTATTCGGRQHEANPPRPRGCPHHALSRRGELALRTMRSML